MTKINFVLTDGSAQSLDVPVGTSIRDAALAESVPGIEGECGGFLNCATCHVYVDDGWLARIAPVDELEDEMLDSTAAERRPSSRLSCQLLVEPDWEGLTVEIPETQY
jgi:2Fe-2S ferredoxin